MYSMQDESHATGCTRSFRLAENPLLPHRKLQELYTLMERARVLERKTKRASYPREAMLAAATIHLAPGDALVTAVRDTSAMQLAPPSKRPVAGAKTYTPTTARLPLAAATARGLQMAAQSGLVLALAEAGTAEPGWSEALAWAQSERLPLVLLCTDPTGLSPAPPRGNRSAEALNSETLHVTGHKLGLPTLVVDGEDAVAMFRVVQESTLRARTQAGPSVIWAVFSAPVGRPAAPLARLRRYMAARDIPLPR